MVEKEGRTVLLHVHVRTSEKNCSLVRHFFGQGRVRPWRRREDGHPILHPEDTLEQVDLGEGLLIARPQHVQSDHCRTGQPSPEGSFGSRCRGVMDFFLNNFFAAVAQEGGRQEREKRRQRKVTPIIHVSDCPSFSSSPPSFASASFAAASHLKVERKDP